MWQLLAEWVDADATTAPSAEKRFRANADQARALWCAALSWRRALSSGLGVANGMADSERVPTNPQLRYQLWAWHQRRSAAAWCGRGPAGPPA